MTEKWGQIQKKWDLVRVGGGVRVIRVRVTGVLLYFCAKNLINNAQIHLFSSTSIH